MSGAASALQQQSIGDTPTDWSQTLDFAQFDPSLGTLTGAAVGLSADVVGSIILENLDLAPATFGVGYNATVQLNAPDGSSLASVAPAANASTTLAPGASTALSGVSGSASTQTQYQVGTQPGGPAVAPFVGTGSVPLSISAQSSLQVTGPGNMALVAQEAAGASATLHYGYAPANSGGGGAGGGDYGDFSYFSIDGGSNYVNWGLVYGPSPYVTTAPQTFSFADRITGWNDSLPVVQFDPSLGTLASVNITLSGDLAGAVSAENLGATPATFSASDTATLTLDLPDAFTITATGTVSDKMSLSAFDGSADFAGTSGHADPLSLSSSGFTQSQYTADPGGFTGNGVVVLPLSATSAATINGPGNLMAGLLTQAGATASISYTYVPATSSTAGGTSGSVPTAEYSIFDATTNKPDTTTAPLANQELVDPSSDNLAVSVTSDNWVIATGGGNDAITAHGGNNVLEGGGGSNFLIGAGGDDTFGVQAGEANAWSAVVNFHAGDLLVVWGVSAQDSVSWLNGLGSAGYTGLTMDAVAPDGTATAVTLARYYSSADLGNGRLTTGFGTDPASGANYLYVHANN